MNEIKEWDDEIDRLGIELAIRNRDRDAAAEGTPLRDVRQAMSDHTNYRKLAYELARPVLADLIGERNRAQWNAAQHRDRAVADAAFWSRWSAGTGLTGGALLLLWLTTSVPWWVGAGAIVLLIACVVAVFAAVASHRDQPDTAVSGQLSARIDAIRAACRAASDADGLTRVQTILNPPEPKASRALSRLL